MNIFISPNLGKENTLTCLHTLRQCFQKDKNCLLYQSKYKKELESLGDMFSDNLSELMSLADLLIAVGGDGTIIHAAKLAAEAGKPVLGINSGYLGFTAGLEPEELGKLAQLTEGELPTEERIVLNVRVESAQGEEKLTCHAINDAVISRGTLSRIIELNVTENGRPAISCRADGLIVSTPTGSTAYALSAGGPVISPQLSCISVTPICAHDLTSRTIIFGERSELCITSGSRGNIISDAQTNEIYLTVDGEISCHLESDDRVYITKSEISAYFITLKQLGFSEILRMKFHF